MHINHLINGCAGIVYKLVNIVDFNYYIRNVSVFCVKFASFRSDAFAFSVFFQNAGKFYAFLII